MDKKAFNNHLLSERIIITKEIENKYGIFIDVYSKNPLMVRYGEVTVINNDGTSKNNVASGSLCFSIESYSIRKEERFHSIYLCGALCTPTLSIFDTPFSQSQQRNCYDPISIKHRINDFFSAWSSSNDLSEIRGNVDDLTLFIYGSQSGDSILQIKFLSINDYYTVAAWFILVEANKYFKEGEQTPVYEAYWPDCRYYHKREKTGDLSKPYAEKKELIRYFTSDTDEELKKRESASPIGFTGLLLSHLFGFYDEKGNPKFLSDANVVNVRFGDGVLMFDVVNSDAGEQIELVGDFTFSPVLYVVKNNETNSKVNYLGDASSDEEKHDGNTILKAETVDAPYLSVWPLFFECRLYSREGEYQTHYEASVFKTYLSRGVLNENGDLDMKKVWNQMTWEQTAPQKGDKEE